MPAVSVIISTYNKPDWLDAFVGRLKDGETLKPDCRSNLAAKALRI